MESEDKVFSSNIMRDDKPLNNNLRDLITADCHVFSSNVIRDTTPLGNDLRDLLNQVNILPTVHVEEKTTCCSFVPNTEKTYVPKKRLKYGKVKTVREIRQQFENDVFSYLPNELQKQEEILLKKIMNGSSNDAQAVSLAKNVIKSESPLSRSLLHIIANMNPEKNNYTSQFVLYNGMNIRVSGSKGGLKKFLCCNDLAKQNKMYKNRTRCKAIQKQKLSLLRKSLAVKFKPGPLTKKSRLDVTHHNYNMGTIELIKLPKVGIVVEPSLGIPIEPTISNILDSLRDSNGALTEKWAEFAVSTLSNKNKTQQKDKNWINFELNYENNQNQVLMRNEFTSTFMSKLPEESDTDETVGEVIQKVLEDMIKTVEISLIQDSLYHSDESNKVISEEALASNSLHVKEKAVKKCNELAKLDVTVIRINNMPEDEMKIKCLKPFCILGCICSSLACYYNLKNHCGQLDCMFGCKCDISKYGNVNNDEEEIIQGLLNADSKITSRLAKEEKKFHQTVVLTDTKSILLKSQKRILQKPKRYRDFINGENYEYENAKKLSVLLIKLKFDRVEPWCMVHNLYKCFCKGRFLKTSIYDSSAVVTKETENYTADLHIKKLNPSVLFNNYESDSESLLKPIAVQDKIIELSDSQNTNSESHTLEPHTRLFNSQSRRKKYIRSIRTESESDAKEYLQKSDKNIFNNGNTNYCSKSIQTCARVQPFIARRFSDKFYIETNKKILEIEKNDTRLQAKMLKYVQSSTATDPNIASSNDDLGAKDPIIASSTDDLEGADPMIFSQSKKDLLKLGTSINLTRNELLTWLETNYKLYRERLEKGSNKFTMEAPVAGKYALYPWHFILERFKEKKNLFMVSKTEPYRIYIAIDVKDPFFMDCTNIEQIESANLFKYPVTVRDLLGNCPANQNYFYILIGLKKCWQIIGSVTKMEDKTVVSDHTVSNPKPCYINQEIKSINTTPDISSKEELSENSLIIDLESNEDSKWFVMTVENDFSEIKLHSHGFFVSHESILTAMNVARISGKAVRLSPRNSQSQFGFYAIPYDKECCVFVGPYDKDEALDIEKVNNKLLKSGEKRTRGLWIKTKKVDNGKVIENPLAFLPDVAKRSSTTVSLLDETEKDFQETIPKHTRKRRLSSNCEGITHDTEEVSNNESYENCTKKATDKVVKPIKISKSNGFYQLSGFGSLKKIPILKNKNCKVNFNTEARSNKESSDYPTTKVSTPVINESFSMADQNKTKFLDIKYSDLNNLLGRKETESVQVRSGMLVLRPEEINKRLSENRLYPNSSDIESAGTLDDKTMYSDIESFLATAKTISPPSSDIYVISDDEDAGIENVTGNKKCTEIKPWTEVWIECKNVENVGWIKGRRNNTTKELSFQFPGFNFTTFYQIEEAFDKINQALSRKIYIPVKLKIEWNIVENERDLNNKSQLKSDFGRDHIFLNQGGLWRYMNKIDCMNKLKNELVQAVDMPLQEIIED